MKNDLGALETVTNNFDLIRLFAASQVAITHTSFHFGITGWIIDLLELFPGVPVFFFISGYLIYGSYENQKNKDRPLLQFYKNRFLRLYPALFGVMTFSLVAFFATGYLSQVDFEVRNLIVWFVAGSAGLQFTPSFLNGYGTGSVNGSLWT